MILGHYIDPNTFVMRQPIMVDPEDVPPGVVTVRCPDGLYLPTWDDTKQTWFDGRPAPARTKADAAKARQAAIDLQARTIRDGIVAGISAAEMASWPIKRAEAQTYQAGTDTTAPNLTVEAQARGIALADLVTLVLNKSAQLSQLEATIAGNAGKHSDAVIALLNDAAATIDQIDSYDYSAGWPV